MNTTCPACTKAVDPLRSRFVGVRDGKVVAFCSAECAAKGTVATKPVIPARTATPPAGVPARVVTDVSSGPPRPITPPPGVPVALESGPVIEIIRDRTEPRAKHPDEIPIAAFWTADKEKSGPVRMPGDAGAPVAAKDKSVPAAAQDKSVPVAAAKDKSVPVAAAKDKSVPVAAAKDKSVPVAAAKDKSVPVKAATHPVRAFAEPAPDFSISDLMPVRKSRAPIVILLLVLIGAGGFVLYYVLSASAPAAPKATPAPPRAVAEPAPPAPVISPDALVDQARAALVAATTQTSPRVARLAAEALARTEDPHALDLLGRQLGLKSPEAAGSAGPGSAAPIVETSDIARLDLAYALARGHDKRGSDALGAALASQRAEVRDEAARLLAVLGDARAVPHLTDLLAVSQRRLGAAELLVHLAEPHAIKALEQLRADPKAPADDKARATIALGSAGHADVAPALREMLTDAHFNAFAAAALAELKDATARPVLVRQLDSPALRVRAARALRRLDPALDAHEVAAPLLEVMRSGRDTDQVQAAEAVLLLFGPLAWSTFE
jgi:HEAT repeat protein